jgi:putative spermidine/putrescine transport system substrate-binding protein
LRTNGALGIEKRHRRKSRDTKHAIKCVSTQPRPIADATASMEQGADFTVNMDGRVIELDLFGIPNGSQYKDEAINFIRFASSSTALADMVGYLPNGPTRKPLVALLSDEVLAQIPNGPAYDDTLFILSDAQWWAANHARLKDAFQSWRAVTARQGAVGATR